MKFIQFVRSQSIIKLCVGLSSFLISLFVVLSLNNEKREENEEEGNALEAFQWWYGQRALPNENIPPQALYKAQQQLFSLKHKQALKSDPFSFSEWESIGPNNVGGRILSLAINPDSTNIIWAGSASGGLWKSTTHGRGSNAWSYISTGYPAISISAIVIDPNNHDIIYIGTGEISYYQTPLIGIPGARASYGMGILKSTDAGTTWSTTSLTFQFSQITAIQRIVINPQNSSTIYAATSEGVYKTTDAGQNWNVSNPNVMAMDVALNPSDTTILYSAHGNLNSSPNQGLYRSTDAGVSWTLLSNGLPPQSNFGRTALAISPSSPNVVYAGITNGATRSMDALYCLYKTFDNGNSWSKVTVTNYVGGQGWYNNAMKVHPESPDVIYCAGLDFYKSTVGGTSLIRISNWGSYYLGNITPGGIEGDTTQYVHADQHAIAFNPSDPENIFIGTDGGVFETTNGGESFQGRNGGLVTTQFYNGFASGYQSDIIALGGLQDNGVLKYIGIPSWSKVDDGDGGYNAIDRRNPNVMFDEYIYLAISKSVNGGLSWSSSVNGLLGGSNNANFIAPFIISPSNPDILYAGNKSVYKTTTGGSSWFAPGSTNLNGTNVCAIGVSWTNPDSLMAATGIGTYGSSATYQLYSSKNGGVSWFNVTGSLPSRFLTDIHFDSTDSKTVYITYSGYGTSHVFKTTNFGQSWIDISSGLPDIPVQSVVCDPQEPSYVYIGTDLGVYLSSDRGEHWSEFNSGMPLTMVTDVNIVHPGGYLRAATFGNGVYQRLLKRNPQLTLLTPLGVEHFVSGKNTLISWNEKYCSDLRLEFSSDNGASWDIIADSISASQLSYTWNIPFIYTSDAKIRIVHLGEIYISDSTTSFSIIPTPDVLEGWNMVSVNVIVPDPATLSIFPTSISSAFVYNHGYYVQEHLESGSGYWLKFAQPQYLTVTGDSLFSDTVNVQTGWNIIGSISTPTASSNIVQIPDNIIVSSFFGFNDIYSIADSIRPMKGYWVKVNQDGMLILSSSGSFSKSIESHDNNFRTLNSITIEDATGKKQILYFGMNASNLNSQWFEMPPLPPADCFDVRFSSNRFVESLQNMNESGSELPVHLMGTRFPLKVTLDNIENLRVELATGGQKFTMHNGSAVTITNPAQQFKLKIKKESVVTSPVVMQLYQNYPNPFNPNTEIRFKIDEARFTTLKIYNSLGKEIATLISEIKQPGDYSILWDATGIPSGVYFYRLEAGSKSFTKKLLLLK